MESWARTLCAFSARRRQRSDIGGTHGKGGVAKESSPRLPVLSAAEHEAAGSILSDAWGEQVAVSAAEVVWKRRHVVRLETRDGRSAIMKRLRRRRQGRRPAGTRSVLSLDI